MSIPNHTRRSVLIGLPAAVATACVAVTAPEASQPGRSSRLASLLASYQTAVAAFDIADEAHGVAYRAVRDAIAADPETYTVPVPRGMSVRLEPYLFGPYAAPATDWLAKARADFDRSRELAGITRWGADLEHKGEAAQKELEGRYAAASNAYEVLCSRFNLAGLHAEYRRTGKVMGAAFHAIFAYRPADMADLAAKTAALLDLIPEVEDWAEQDTRAFLAALLPEGGAV